MEGSSINSGPWTVSTDSAIFFINIAFFNFFFESVSEHAYHFSNFSLILCLQYAKIIEFVVMVMTQFQYQWGQLAFISGAPKNTTMRWNISSNVKVHINYEAFLLPHLEIKKKLPEKRWSNAFSYFPDRRYG